MLKFSSFGQNSSGSILDTLDSIDLVVRKAIEEGVSAVYTGRNESVYNLFSGIRGEESSCLTNPTKLVIAKINISL